MLKIAYRHSGRIAMWVHDDVGTNACVTERHVLLGDDEATDT